MMMSLESKLRKDNMVEPFNANVLDFMRRGVIKWVDDLPKIENLQRSYIPLTFTLKSDPETTTKLRICGNSSFKTGRLISLNDCMIPGPQYLNNIEGILLRWQMRLPTPTSRTIITR